MVGFAAKPLAPPAGGRELAGELARTTVAEQKPGLPAAMTAAAFGLKPSGETASALQAS